MTLTRHDIARMQARQGAPVKARRKVGTGDWATRKAWLCRMRCEPGIFLAVRTVTEKNSGGHWTVKAKRAEYQRRLADTAVWAWIRAWTWVGADGTTLKPFTFPIIVTLTRYGARLLDSDNAVSAVAHLRDGIADAFGVDDAESSGIEWVYAEQVKSPRGCYGVRVLIEPALPPCSGCRPGAGEGATHYFDSKEHGTGPETATAKHREAGK